MARAPRFPKAGDWRPSQNNQYAVVSDKRVGRDFPANDYDNYYDGYLVAEVSSPALVPLIAAAPDLLAALEKTARRLDAAAGAMSDLGHFTTFADEAAEARAVISKARGETA